MNSALILHRTELTASSSEEPDSSPKSDFTNSYSKVDREQKRNKLLLIFKIGAVTCKG